MKKLMKAVAAAAVALVASSSFATPLQTTAGFDGFQTGALTIGNLVSAQDNGEQGDARYWFAITNDSVATTGETIGNIVEDSGNKYLALEAQAPLYRTVKPSGDAGAALVVNDPQTIGDGIYLDTMVKFTISQDEFKDGDLENNVDKLAITCYSAEESTDTNILVRAGYVSGQTITPTNYFLNLPGNFDADAWHRLTVRAISNVCNSATATAPVGFAVYLDQSLLTYGTDVAAGDQTYTDALNAAVVNNLYNGTTHALLPSLVAGAATGSGSITAVGFKGTGCLDNVAFTDEKPDFIVEGQSVEITWDDGVATYKVVDSKGVTMIDDEAVSGAGSTNLTLDADIEYLTVTATYDTENGYVAGTWIATTTFANDQFTVADGATLNIVSMIPLYEVNGTSYDSLAAALAAAAAGTAQAPATLKLLADCNQVLGFTEGYVILDLNGCDIQGGADADCSILNSGATLVITNSGAEASVLLPTNQEADPPITLMTAVGSTTVQAGTFEGLVIPGEGENESKLTTITGGKFLDTGSDFYLAGCVAQGVSTTKSGNYVIVGAAEPEPTTWADVLGAAVDGAYEIDDLTELKDFQKYVGTFATANVTFKLTTDITLDAAWEGIGLQNGKDTLNGDKDAGIVADRDAYVAAAFCGTFDGQNHTISGFQMVGVAGNPKNNGEGLDYCGFFNSISGATIQNLKIQYAGSLFAADTTAATKESGATFVGVAHESTLRNLTSLQKDAQTGVSCSKGFGGIAGFVTSGTTVEYCTNNVNLTSMAGNKAGGIAMVVQNGTGMATIRNCVNNGKTAGNAKQKGGIVAYIGTDGSVTIENCTDTAGSAPTFFSKNKGNITVSGVNMASASVVPCQNTDGKAIVVSGLTFATVDNGVATFVADNALALNGEYKVMAAGTATFEFTAAGTIAFDTALATPTYAITAAEGLDLTDATEGTVKTYTATTQSTPVAPGSDDGETYNSAEAATNAAAKVVVAVPDAVKTAGVDTDTYAAMFEAKVVENNNGTYSVVVDLKPEVETAVQTAVDKATVDTLEDVLAADGASASVTVTTKAGLYYQIVTGNALPLAEPDSENWKMATGDSTSITVTKPAGNAAFFKVYCTPAK